MVNLPEELISVELLAGRDKALTAHRTYDYNLFVDVVSSSAEELDRHVVLVKRIGQLLKRHIPGSIPADWLGVLETEQPGEEGSDEHLISVLHESWLSPGPEDTLVDSVGLVGNNPDVAHPDGLVVLDLLVCPLVIHHSEVDGGAEAGRTPDVEHFAKQTEHEEATCVEVADGDLRSLARVPL